jgi:hypothetical protein
MPAETKKSATEIQLQKNSPAPAAPEAGKAQVFFIEKSEKPPAIGCIGCSTITRVGVDGAWVGATKDNSYFNISLDPGVHHLCAVLGKEVDAEPLSVEAGKTYYFQTEYKAEVKQYGTPEHPNYQVEKKVQFSMLNEDDGSTGSRSPRSVSQSRSNSEAPRCKTVPKFGLP